MDYGEALRSHLLTFSTITDLVGTRIFPDTLPQATRGPSLVYSRVTGQQDHTSKGATQLSRPRIQITAWAQKRKQAIALAETVKKEIDGKRWSVADFETQGTFFVTEYERYEPEPDLWRAIKDYYIFFNYK